MKGHATTTISDRMTSMEEIRQELQGRSPKGPFEFSEDLSFDSVTEESAGGDSRALAMFKLAVQRDSRYATAGAPYLRVFGLSQGIRSIYDGGRQLIDAGVTK